MVGCWVLGETQMWRGSNDEGMWACPGGAVWRSEAKGGHLELRVGNRDLDVTFKGALSFYTGENVVLDHVSYLSCNPTQMICLSLRLMGPDCSEF